MSMIKYFRYLVLFKSSLESFSEQAITVSDIETIRKENAEAFHKLDPDFDSVLSILEYCLHLPRCELDTCEIEPEVLNSIYDTVHNILLVPASIAFDKNYFEYADIVFCGNSCYLEVKNRIDEEGKNVECVSAEQLSEEMLKKHWLYLYNKRLNKSLEKVSDIENQRLLNGDRMLFLPFIFYGRQFGPIDEIYERVFDSTDVFKDCSEIAIHQACCKYALEKCEDITDESIAEEAFLHFFEEAKREARINLVITSPGVAPSQRRYCGLLDMLPESERRMIRILGLHRAIAKNGLLMELPLVTDSMFKKLNDLELACKSETRANNKYIHKSLSSISSLIESYINAKRLKWVKNAKHITIFSDFPLCLFIPSGSDTTLQCQKEISSRPISPLTKCVSIELLQHSQHYLGNRCRVMFVECVPDTKENKFVRKGSNVIIKNMETCVRTSPKFQYDCFEAYTVEDLKSLLNKQYSNYDILLISAHGFYERDFNISGLIIGNEQWIAETSDFSVPPIVLLSACHVSPRGSGTISAADQLIARGAETVLSTFVPIDSLRNAILIGRFFTNIANSQIGISNYSTLSEAWSSVAASNAVLEMAEQSKRFKKWIMGENKDHIIRFTDFALNRSKGRLKARTSYSDTITIIKEMLKEEGLENKFSDILDGNNFFPESFFYQWIGFPENIFINNKTIQKYLDGKASDKA